MAKFNEAASAAIDEIVARFTDDPDWIGERIMALRNGLVDDEVDLSGYVEKDKYDKLMTAYSHILQGIQDAVEEDDEKKAKEEAEKLSDDEITTIEDVF